MLWSPALPMGIALEGGEGEGVEGGETKCLGEGRGGSKELAHRNL